MSNLKEKIKQITESLKTELQNATTIKKLEDIRINFLGKKGQITSLMPELKNLSVEDKKIFGPILNNLKHKSLEQINIAKEELIKKQAQLANAKKENFDLTLNKPTQQQGNTHIITKFVEEVENIFISMGFDLFSGPEIETDYYNFTTLNIPDDHPAKDMYDTLWLNKPNMLLRTHTSPTQIHVMQTHKPPIAGISIGKTFRHEAIDATHDFEFMQCEGILIDKNITLSNLFAVAKKFLQELFHKKDLDIRIRPGYFPFVEPGVEIDMRCPFCKKGCSICKKTTWIEVFPGGLIHPNVLKFGNIDPKKYSGFAFGFGLTRLIMLQHNINDIRLLHSGKIKFLEQF